MGHRATDEKSLRGAGRGLGSGQDIVPAIGHLGRLLMLATLVGLVAGVGGCGSDDGPSSRRGPAFSGVGVADPSETSPAPPPPANAQPPGAPAAPEQAPGSPENTSPDADGEQANDGPTHGAQANGGETDSTSTDDGQSDAEAENGDQAKTDEPRERPEDVAEWIKEDYFSARAENDPKLLEAVRYLGEQFVGNTNVAAGLAALLPPPKVEPDEPKEGQPQQPPGGQRDAKPLIEAIVAALGANGTDAARTVLEQVLAGKVATDDEQTAISAVLSVLVKNVSPQNEEVLFRLLTEPEKLRPQADGQTSAEQLRERTLAAVTPVASDQLRTRLAGYLVQPTTSDSTRGVLGKFLEEDRIENLGAQLVLCLGDKTPEETKAKLQTYFTAYSSRTLAEVLGLPAGASTGPTGRGGNTQPGQEDPELPYRLAGQLWNAQWVAEVERRLAALESLEGQKELLGLAGTIPADSTRSIMLQVMQKYFDDGPKHVEATGLSKDLVGDPGLVALTKLLMRDSASSANIRSKELRDQFMQTSESWKGFSDGLVETWCERLQAAAQARADGQPNPPKPAAEAAGAMPIAVHADADVKAIYHAVWPDDLAGKLSGVSPDPMQLHYVRLEGKAQYKITVGFYRRQVKPRARDARQIQNVDWLESLRTNAQTGRLSSIDVRITRTEAKDTSSTTTSTARKGADEIELEDLIIEVLAVEIMTPATSGG
ncbi:MAG: hypothetical protein JXB62_04915 [Pirellulales bacterium]|nr:hypothetical protein [Pirellulales bacterium]